MAKSKARFLSELLGSTGLVKKSKSELAGADEVLDLDVIPSIPNSKLTNSSISIAGHSTALGGSVSLNTGNITEHTDYKYFTDARARGAVSVSGDLAYNSSTGVISFTERTDAEVRGLFSAGGSLSYNSTTGVMSFTMPAQNTSNITEGTNLYFTNARARSAISATGSLSYNSTTGVMSFTMPAQNTSNITEGTNLYYTNARADARIAAASTSDLSEGTNLYYTDARADARVALIVDSAPGTLNTLNELAAALGDDANFSTTVTNSIATKLPLAGGALTGAVTTNSTFDGRNVSVDGAKLDGIEAGATADQTAAQILTAIKTVDGSGSGLDADLLDGSNSATFLNDNNYLYRSDNRIISPDEYTSGRLRFGFTSWANNNTSPYADFLHMRSYTDSSGGSDNLLMFSKGSKNMRLWQQSFGSSTAYSSYVDFWHTGNDGSGSGLDADLLDGQHGSYYTTAANLTGDFPSFVQIGDSASYGTNNGSWGARLNVTDNVHAKIEVGQDANSMLSHWYAHTGQDSIKFGTSSAHDVEFQRGGTTRLELTSDSITFSGSINMNGHNIRRGNHHTGHLEGSYNNIGGNGTKSNPIYTIGSSYNPGDAALSNMYGIGYTDASASFISFTGAASWGMYVAADGDARVWLGGSNGVVTSTGQHYVGSNVVWNAGNDGSGSGLDADTVDGIQASSFLRSDAEDTTSGSLIIAEDWSSGTYNGQFVIQGSYPSWETRGTSAQPYGWLHHQDSSGNYTLYSIAGYTGTSWTQRFTFNHSDQTFRNGGSSGNVYYHQGNDGSGSGLDADLLDGYNAEETAVNNSIVKRDGNAMITAKKLYLNGGSYEGQIIFGAVDVWRTGIRQHDDGDAEMRIWAKHANGRVHIATGYDGQPASITKPADGFVVDHNNVGIGNFSGTDPSQKLHVKGSVLVESGNVHLGNNAGLTSTTSGEALRVLFPGGGARKNSGSSETGAIKVTLPVGMTNSMLSFKITVYQYNTDDSFEVHVGGYNYPTGNTWQHNPFGYITSSPKANHGPYAIRFGYDSNSKACVYIGETTTVWSYPQIAVTEALVGYSGYTNTSWDDGWDVSIATSFENVTHTIAATDTSTVGWHPYNDGSGSGLDADLLDGQQGSYYQAALGTSARWPIAYISGHAVNSYDKLRVWNDSSYTIGMHSGQTYGWLNDYAMTFQMNNDSDRGFVWRHSAMAASDGAMSLTTGGNLSVKNAISLGGSTSSYMHVGSWGWRHQTSSGYIEFGPANTSHAHIYTDRPNFYFNKQLLVLDNTVWNAGNDGSGSGLDADLLDGANAAESGASTIHKLASNGYSMLANWTHIAGTGLYSGTTNGAHWYPNTATSYGTWRIDGSRGGYSGIYLHSGGAVVIGMYDSGGNGGDYHQASGKWSHYWHRGNTCLGINNSTTSSSYSLYVTGAIYATNNITAYSDRRVKENIVQIDGALEKVNKLTGVYYNKIDDEKKNKEIGFIAQDVNEVVPELVTYAEDVDQYGVKYGNTTALLVEAVKELTQQVKDLKQEIDKMKEKQ